MHNNHHGGSYGFSKREVAIRAIQDQYGATVIYFQESSEQVMPLDPAIQRSERWMIQCASLVDGVTFPTTNRARVSVSLHHLCIEHHTGIHTLIDQRVNGSAFALFRPQLEAYVRGAWYYFCANERQINKFLNGSDPPQFGILIRELESTGGFDSGSLSRMKNQIWGNLNDFTHGGAIQVKARNIRDEIIQSYKPEHVTGLITSSATLSLLASVGIAAVADDTALANSLHKAYKAIFEEAV